MQIFKNKKILFSLILIVLLVLISVFYTMYFQKDLKPIPPKTDAYGILEGPPFTSKQVPPFGTDELGYPILYLLIKGAKYTVGIAILVAFLRLVMGLIIGVGLTLFPKWVQKGVEQILSPFHYLPVSLLSYLVLVTILLSTTTLQPDFMGAAHQHERIIFEFLFLSIVGVPPLLIYFKDTTLQFLKEDHITAARVLGASKWTILRKHIWLGIKGRVAVQYVEQILQTLTLMIHLGFFKLLFGGSVVHFFPFDQKPPIYQSLTSEWSGLIGNGYANIELHPSLTIIPLVAFAVLIYLFSLLREGLKESLSLTSIVSGTRLKSSDKRRKIEDVRPIEAKDFTLISEREAG